jgi:transcriptional regulatory protein LevR
MDALLGAPMARTKSESTKIDADVLRDARIVTAVTGEGLSEYLSKLLRPIVAKQKEEALEQEKTGKARSRTDEPKKRGNRR